MNVYRLRTIAIPTLSATTRSDHSLALVMLATAETALIARVSRVTCHAIMLYSLQRVYTFLGTSCAVLEPLENGSISGETNLCGENVTFACNDGYRLSGSSSRQCGINSLWSGTISFCSGIKQHSKHYLIKR